MNKYLFCLILTLFLPSLFSSSDNFWNASTARAQVGEYRNDFAFGASAGYVMSNIAFVPKVVQNSKSGYTFGLNARYTCEKYFSTICSVCAEVNYVQAGWKERIETEDRQPVVNSTSGVAEEYQRSLNYIQIPFLAHLAWGKETKGLQFFFEAGPQFGYMLSESATASFPLDDPNLADRANQTVRQYSMAVENKFDYGICAGIGLELTLPKLGHYLLSGRYYYGLGNIYGDSKRDFFARSNHGQIAVRLSYLFR